jgi:hypothetical protein
MTVLPIACLIVRGNCPAFAVVPKAALSCPAVPNPLLPWATARSPAPVPALPPPAPPSAPVPDEPQAVRTTAAAAAAASSKNNS